MGPSAYHENWLNEGPYQSYMNVQKVPTPDDLMTAPTGNFSNIDRCVAHRIFDLNNTAYVNNGKSPHCPIIQVHSRGWGEGIYDCSGLRENQTVKGTL